MNLLPDYSAHPPFLCSHSLSNARLAAMRIAMEMIRGTATGILQFRNVVVAGGPSSYGLVRLVRSSIAWTTVVTDDSEFAELIESPTWEIPDHFSDQKSVRSLGRAFNSTPDDVIRLEAPLLTLFSLKGQDSFRAMYTPQLMNSFPEGSLLFLEVPLPPPRVLLEKFLHPNNPHFGPDRDDEVYSRQAPFLGFAQHLANETGRNPAGNMLLPLLLSIGETGGTPEEPTASLILLAKKLRRPTAKKLGKELRRYQGIVFASEKPTNFLLSNDPVDRYRYGSSYGMELTSLQRLVEQGPDSLRSYIEADYFPKGSPYYDTFVALASKTGDHRG